jgi:hypothetical protein
MLNPHFNDPFMGIDNEEELSNNRPTSTPEGQQQVDTIINSESPETVADNRIESLQLEGELPSSVDLQYSGDIPNEISPKHPEAENLDTNGNIDPKQVMPNVNCYQNPEMRITNGNNEMGSESRTDSLIAFIHQEIGFDDYDQMVLDSDTGAPEMAVDNGFGPLHPEIGIENGMGTVPIIDNIFDFQFPDYDFEDNNQTESDNGVNPLVPENDVDIGFGAQQSATEITPNLEDHAIEVADFFELQFPVLDFGPIAELGNQEIDQEFIDAILSDLGLDSIDDPMDVSTAITEQITRFGPANDQAANVAPQEQVFGNEHLVSSDNSTDITHTNEQGRHDESGNIVLPNSPAQGLPNADDTTNNHTVGIITPSNSQIDSSPVSSDLEDNGLAGTVAPPNSPAVVYTTPPDLLDRVGGYVHSKRCPRGTRLALEAWKTGDAMREPLLPGRRPLNWGSPGGRVSERTRIIENTTDPVLKQQLIDEREEWRRYIRVTQRVSRARRKAKARAERVKTEKKANSNSDTDAASDSDVEDPLDKKTHPVYGGGRKRKDFDDDDPGSVPTAV